nr:MAG TPA: Putative collagen-binding domain of a collagenase [Caudoviricetes sp.]
MWIPADERKKLGIKANYRAAWFDPTTNERCSALVRLVVIDGDVVARVIDEQKRESTVFERYIGNGDCNGEAGRRYQYIVFCSFKAEEMSIIKKDLGVLLC